MADVAHSRLCRAPNRTEMANNHQPGSGAEAWSSSIVQLGNPVTRLSPVARFPKLDLLFQVVEAVRVLNELLMQDACRIDLGPGDRIGTSTQYLGMIRRYAYAPSRGLASPGREKSRNLR